MSIINKIVFAVAVGIIFNLTGCSSGSSSSSGTASPSAVQIQGIVSAPGTTTGSIAFAQPDTSFKSMFASLFTSQAQAAAVAGTAPVGAGVTVNLIEINNSGNQVGSAVATTTTLSDGSYTLSAPSTFAAATKYVVRATSTTDATKFLDSIVTSTTVDVDPGTDVTKSLVIAAASGVGISNVTPEAVAEIQKIVEDLGNEIDSTAFTDLATTKTLLTAQSSNDEEASNIISSIVSSGVISGTVTDSSSIPLPNIKIVVRDFNNWVTRAVTRTDASGAYTLHVPAGNYILGALNMTGTSTAASEWWTAAGGVANQFSADKITVTTMATKDFVLDPGVRISGTVTGATTSVPVRGIQIQLRDYVNDEPAAGVQTKIDGTYRINLRPGSYTVGAYNATLQPYATQLYNSTLTNGGTNASQAEKVTLTLGTPKTANFSLLTGRIISGTVTDSVGGTVVPGMAVRFYTNTGAFVRGVRTNKLGKYRLWLLPNATGQSYIVRSRGQALTEDLSTASQTAQDFTAPVGQITATLKDASNNPVSQAKVGVYNSTTAAYQGFEASNGDGTVTLYSTITPVVVEYKIDNGTTVSSYLHIAAVSFGTAITVPVTTNITTPLGTITLASGGVLSGIIDVGGMATGDRVVQVRNAANNTVASQFVSTRSQFDGSYSISLPAGTYSVRACNPGLGCSTFTIINIGIGGLIQNLTSPS